MKSGKFEIMFIAIVILFVFLIVFSQKNNKDIYYFDEEISLCWSEVTTDVNGTKEDSIYYRVFVKKIYPDTADVYVGISVDTTMRVLSKNFEDGKYIIGVQAVDMAGNKSNILWSNDVRNTFGKWLAGIDRAKPENPKFIRYN